MERKDREDFWGRPLAMIFAGVAVLSVLCWAWGQLAALLAGGGRPHAGLLAMPKVLFKLPGYTGDPRMAWPEADRAVLPGVGGFALSGLLIAAGLVLLVMAWRRLRGRKRKASDPKAAEWATRRDLRALRVSRPGRGRVVLGRHRGALIAAEAEAHVLALAPTRSGKTTGVLTPAVLEEEGAVIALDLKGEIYEATVAARRARGGRVFVYDPTGSLGLPEDQTAGWNPLDGCATVDGARKRAAALVARARTRAGLQDADFWAAAAAKLLWPALFAAAVDGRAIGEVRSWIDTREREEVEEVLEGARAPKAVEAWQAVWSAQDDRQRESVYATAEQALDVFADDAVERACQRAEITPETFFDGRPNTLYLVAPPAEMARLAPLFVGLVEALTNYAFARQTAREPVPPTLLALDEAPNGCPLPSLPDLAAMGAGANLRLLTIAQDLSQLAAIYGDRAETIASNHRALLVLPGVRCQRTLGYLRTVLGDEEVEQVSVTAGPAGGVRSEQRSTHRVGLGRAEVIRQLEAGTAVLVYGALPPARLRLRFWFKDARLRRLAASGAPAPAPRRQLPARAGEAVPSLGADVAAALVVDRATGEVLAEAEVAQVIDLEARREAAAAIDQLEAEVAGGEGEGGEEGTR